MSFQMFLTLTIKEREEDIYRSTHKHTHTYTTHKDTETNGQMQFQRMIEMGENIELNG